MTKNLKNASILTNRGPNDILRFCRARINLYLFYLCSEPKSRKVRPGTSAGASLAARPQVRLRRQRRQFGPVPKKSLGEDGRPLPQPLPRSTKRRYSWVHDACLMSGSIGKHISCALGSFEQIRFSIYPLRFYKESEGVPNFFRRFFKNGAPSHCTAIGISSLFEAFEQWW